MLVSTPLWEDAGIFIDQRVKAVFNEGSTLFGLRLAA